MEVRNNTSKGKFHGTGWLWFGDRRTEILIPGTLSAAGFTIREAGKIHSLKADRVICTLPATVMRKANGAISSFFI